MNKDIAQYAKTRHSAKAFDSKRKISAENIEKVKELLRYSASSVNSQPWHFIIASTDEAKKRIAKSTDEIYPFNSTSITNASHVVVFCSKLDIDEDYIQKILEQEEKDGRFLNNPDFKTRQNGARNMFVNLHKKDLNDLNSWMDKQVYLNLGAFLLGVATLGIDAVPMEGVDFKILDEELNLKERGCRSIVVVPIGYNDPENDYNATLPKSRLPYSEILTEL